MFMQRLARYIEKRLIPVAPVRKILVDIDIVREKLRTPNLTIVIPFIDSRRPLAIWTRQQTGTYNHET
jgi:hypothetical protein